MRTVSVFGGAQAKPGSECYRMAEQLGALLANAGYAVACGGYSGIMEAVARGAASHGGHTIGYTLDPFGPANTAIKEEVRCRTLHERLDRLIRGSVAAIALKGSIGTLAEVFIYWNLLQMRSVSSPLILLGNEWQALLRHIQADFLVRPKDVGLLRLALTPEEALSLIRCS